MRIHVPQIVLQMNVLIIELSFLRVHMGTRDNIETMNYQAQVTRSGSTVLGVVWG